MFPTQQPETSKTFDLDTAHKTITGALMKLLMLSLRDPAAPPTESDAGELMTAIRDALLSGSMACSEITRIRDSLIMLRDTHRPRPHADPSTPGALCEACSLRGALVTWPCETWTAADKTLTHGQP